MVRQRGNVRCRILRKQTTSLTLNGDLDMHTRRTSGSTRFACHNHYLSHLRTLDAPPQGWTTYIERVLAEKLHSPAERAFSFIIGAKALRDALSEYADRPKYQRLVIDFERGEDPDDAYSTVPYEKGANFILHLGASFSHFLCARRGACADGRIERTLGGLEVFLPYVKDYVATYQGKSITTEQWKEHLYAYWKEHGGEEKIKALDGVKWKACLQFSDGFLSLN